MPTAKIKLMRNNNSYSLFSENQPQPQPTESEERRFPFVWVIGTLMIIAGFSLIMFAIQNAKTISLFEVRNQESRKPEWELLRTTNDGSEYYGKCLGSRYPDTAQMKFVPSLVFARLMRGNRSPSSSDFDGTILTYKFVGKDEFIHLGDETNYIEGDSHRKSLKPNPHKIKISETWDLPFKELKELCGIGYQNTKSDK